MLKLVQKQRQEFFCLQNVQLCKDDSGPGKLNQNQAGGIARYRHKIFPEKFF